VRAAYRDALRDAVRADLECSEGAVERAQDVVRGRFEFLNRGLDLPVIDWRARYVSHLWTYNLHYFDYAADLATAWLLTRERAFVDRFLELAGEWISATADGRSDGWDPYPTSLRTANWLRATLAFDDALPQEARARILASTHAQLRHLGRRLEWHLLGNHLLKNLHALALGGLVLEGAEAAEWRGRLRAAFWEQAAEQFESDGGHIERSPMYHAIALADVLEILHLDNLCGEPSSDDRLALAERAIRAFRAWTRPDGTLHLFNDAANGIAPDAARIAARARAAGIDWPDSPEGPWALPASGFFGYADEATGERFIIDAGPPGPPYQPAHAHCGVLSFELDMDGRAFIVDSGTSGYEGDPLRAYVRSTRAHNTVMIGDREQSEVWGVFRMARRAVVPYARIERPPGAFVFSGACSPYHDRAAVHHRLVARTDAGWRIIDRVAGAVGARVAGYLHVHPDFRLAADGESITADAGDTRI